MIFNRINYRSLFGNTWLLIGIAIVTAGGITWFTYRYITVSEQRIKADAEKQHRQRGVSVVVPNTDVEAGTSLSSGMFVAREIPADLVYDDMLRASDYNRYRLATLVKPVQRGRPLRAQDIDTLHARDFSDILPAGTRALTLLIDTVNSTDSMLRPGNRIDIYWIGTRHKPSEDSAGNGQAQSVLLLLPDVLVLATGHDTRPRDAGEAARDMADGASRDTYSTITLQVPMAEATRIVLAQKLGSLRLILRNSADKASPPARLDDTQLFETEAREPVAEDGLVEIIAGGSGAATSRFAPMPEAGTAAEARHAGQGGADERGRAAEAPLPDGAASAASPDAHKQRNAYRAANALARGLQAAIDAAGSSQ